MVQRRRKKIRLSYNFYCYLCGLCLRYNIIQEYCSKHWLWKYIQAASKFTCTDRNTKTSRPLREGPLYFFRDPWLRILFFRDLWYKSILRPCEFEFWLFRECEILFWISHDVWKGQIILHYSVIRKGIGDPFKKMLYCFFLFRLQNIHVCPVPECFQNLDKKLFAYLCVAFFLSQRTVIWKLSRTNICDHPLHTSRPMGIFLCRLTLLILPSTRFAQRLIFSLPKLSAEHAHRLLILFVPCFCTRQDNYEDFFISNNVQGARGGGGGLLGALAPQEFSIELLSLTLLNRH